MISKLLEFVEDGDGRASASRLNMTVGVLVGSFAIIWQTVTGNLEGTIFGAYLLATGGVYSVGKYRESVERVEQTKADSPNPAPVVVPVPAPLGPTTMIQVGPNGKTLPDPPPIIVKGRKNASIKPARKS